MNGSDEPVFIDTNILVYAYDLSAGAKHEKARHLIKKCWMDEAKYCLSNQVLAEFSFVLANKIERPLPKNEVCAIINEINSFDGFKKLNYTTKTVGNALNNREGHFWDSLIGETMKENNVFLIYTENTRHFQKIPGIKALNPFAK